MRLIRSHGLGNDYLVLDSGEPMSPARAQALCDRHEGVGGDGVLEPIPSAVADFGLRIWNPDGSLAEKSGNGLRIFAHWARHHRAAPLEFGVEVAAGIARCALDADGDLITVDMGVATRAPALVPCGAPLDRSPLVIPGPRGPERLVVSAVGVGNPHCVLFAEDQDPAFLDDENTLLEGQDALLDRLPWRRWGAALERHPMFPQRTNVQLARVLGPDRLALRVWERGAGETRASGSSACAVAVAAFMQGRASGAVRVEMPGGVLDVWVSPALAVRQRGPVVEIALVETRRSWPR